MKEYGLIGYPLSHSFSARYFAEKFSNESISDCQYNLFPVERIDLLPQLIIDHKNLFGLNVTIPYKEQVISLLDDTEKSIADIGAVNTIKIYRRNRSIRLKGFNTDVNGFGEALKPFIKKEHKNALILGTGGASKAVAYVLQRWGIHVVWISRTPRNSNQISYEMITPELISRSKIIVNTSPVGMYPYIDNYPDIPYKYLTPDHVLFDLIYNPVETKFMILGKSKGATVLNGLQMLHLQANKAWEIWNSDL